MASPKREKAQTSVTRKLPEKSSKSARPRVQSTSQGELTTVIDPEDGFHKALEKLTPKQMARLIARIVANVPPLPRSAKTRTPPKG